MLLGKVFMYPLMIQSDKPQKILTGVGLLLVMPRLDQVGSSTYILLYKADGPFGQMVVRFFCTYQLSVHH